MTENYANQEGSTLANSGMTNEVIAEYERLVAAGDPLPSAIKSDIRQLAIEGSHIARNMLRLTGAEMYYDGQLYSYEGAVFTSRYSKVPREVMFDEWKDINES